MMNELSRMDITTLGDLTQAIEFENDQRTKRTMNKIGSVFPINLQNISKCYNEDINTIDEEVKFIQLENDNRKDKRKISAKEILNVTDV
jgi:hypothetical protein